MNRPDLTIGEMLRACGGVWQGEEALLSCCPANVVTDSRDAVEGSLFIALHGERTDGHKYIPDVLKKGALAVLCSEEAPGEPRLVVGDVMDAMRKIGDYSRRRFDIPFIGVTGSVGKTTAKEMIAAVLSAGFETYKTPGSLNGQIGLPVTLMSLPKGCGAAVIEMGVSMPGEMERLTQLVHPGYAVFTNIGDAHLEFFRDRPGVLREKSKIVMGMPDDGVVFANGDDPLLSGCDFGKRRVLFGLGADCDVRAENVVCTDSAELECRIVTADRAFDVHVPAYGNYMVYSVLAAAAVGMELGMSDAQIARGLSKYATVGHRSRVIRTSYCTLIDDCYNANPTSNRAAIDSMLQLEGRKVCILGDMREMGEQSAKLHFELGRYAVEHGVELIITHGEEAAHITEGAGEIGVHYPDRGELLRALPSMIQQGDVVLVKASHGPNFEDVVSAVEAL